jgi:alpha-beta hydrolase superfamily lysophospholipase
VTVLVIAYAQLPALGAGGLLHPARVVTHMRPPDACRAVDFAGAGVTLRGWHCTSAAPLRGTIVYLHGVGDNRASAAGTIERFTRRGFDVIAYDSRAQGESEGEFCTYGFLERRDLRAVVDLINRGPVVLIGTSLGAAVALQAAADDPRIAAVVAAEPFSDLRTVATERAPFFFSRSTIDQAFSAAERQAGFEVNAASPVAVAPRIRVPVLLIHGDADVDTPPAHSKRIFDALGGPKRLILVPGAGHNGSLRAGIWIEIERWLSESALR